jgi:hypothetical protein
VKRGELGETNKSGRTAAHDARLDGRTHSDSLCIPLAVCLFLLLAVNGLLFVCIRLLLSTPHIPDEVMKF